MLQVMCHPWRDSDYLTLITAQHAIDQTVLRWRVHWITE